MPKTCFVIGPIGDPGTQIRADADDFMEYIIGPCPALKEHGYGKPVRADHLNEPGRITSQVIKLLMEAELVIADLTGNNANVYYELSLRHALGKPVIHMAAEGTRLSFDVRDNRTIFYTMHSRAAERARNELAGQIKHVHQTGYKPTNPIIETAGIIKLEQSSDPEQKSIGHILSVLQNMAAELESLRFDVRTMRAAQAVLTNTSNLLTGGVLPPNLSPTILGSLLAEPPTGLPRSGGGILSDALFTAPPSADNKKHDEK